MNSSSNTPISHIILAIVIGFILFMSMIIPCVNESIPNITPLVLILLILYGLIKFVYVDRRRRKCRNNAPVWYYRDNDNDMGPITMNDFRDLIDSHIVTNETLVWMKGRKQWLSARKALPELFISVPPSIHDANKSQSANTLESHSVGYPREWSYYAMAGLVVATIFIPIVGLIIGLTCKNGSPQRIKQSKTLLIISCIILAIYIVLMLITQALVHAI